MFVHATSHIRFCSCNLCIVYDVTRGVVRIMLKGAGGGGQTKTMRDGVWRGMRRNNQVIPKSLVIYRPIVVNNHSRILHRPSITILTAF